MICKIPANRNAVRISRVSVELLMICTRMLLPFPLSSLWNRNYIANVEDSLFVEIIRLLPLLNSTLEKPFEFSWRLNLTELMKRMST